eukprot:scaffold130300_cov19-Prasinocladus_malaysianus.AAC.1
MSCMRQYDIANDRSAQVFHQTLPQQPPCMCWDPQKRARQSVIKAISDEAYDINRLRIDTHGSNHLVLAVQAQAACLLQG